MKTWISFCAALLLFCGIAFMPSCKKDDDDNNNNNDEPKLVFRFKLDSTQVRLDNFGQPTGVPAGNAGQSPMFNGISAHYIELAQNQWTQIGQGTILYHQQETAQGGANAILHSAASVKNNGEIFFEIPLKDVAAGTYEWLRVSLAYQNFDVKLRVDTTISGFAINQSFDATLASFVGFNTYIDKFTIKTKEYTVNANKKQGYWGFESTFFSQLYSDTGSSAVTTVPNPIASTSPIPAGSCVVTGEFPNAPLVVSGNETEDIIIDVSLSVNKSFEWVDIYANGLWEPLRGEQVVDMGLRGLIPIVQ
jgi:hypothetical protein